MGECFGVASDVLEERSSSEESDVSEEQTTQVFWNGTRPSHYSPLGWRLCQVENYYRHNPEASGDAVCDWILQHRPNPWPEADVATINQMLQYIQSKISNDALFSGNKDEEADVNSEQPSMSKSFIEMNAAVM